MCDVLKADAFLAMLLKARREVRFEDIRVYGDQVQSAHPDIVVDVSAPSIRLALHYHPEVFSRGDGCVMRATNADDLFESDYIQDEFLSSVPQNVSRDVQKVLTNQ